MLYFRFIILSVGSLGNYAEISQRVNRRKEPKTNNSLEYSRQERESRGRLPITVISLVMSARFRLEKCITPTKTRSQAVARIADRTAKNCRGHVT